MRGGATCLHGPRVYRAAAICRCLHYPHWSQLQQLRSLATLYSEMMLPLWRSSRPGDPGSTNTRAGSPYCGCLDIDRAPRWVPTPPLTCCRSRRMEEILFLPRGRQQSPSPVWRLHSLQASYLLTPAAPLCCPHRVLLLPASLQMMDTYRHLGVGGSSGGKNETLYKYLLLEKA